LQEGEKQFIALEHGTKKVNVLLRHTTINRIHVETHKNMVKMTQKAINNNIYYYYYYY